MSEATWDTHTKHPSKPSHFCRLLEEDLQVQCPGQAAPLWVNYTWISWTMMSYTNTFLEGRDPVGFDSASHKSPKPGWNFIRDPSPSSTVNSSTKKSFLSPPLGSPPTTHCPPSILVVMTRITLVPLSQWLLFNDACPREKKNKTKTKQVLSRKTKISLVHLPGLKGMQY